MPSNNNNMSSSSAESELCKATRRSIKKHFPMGAIMCQGDNNPITLHSSVDDELFVRMWALIAETMCVTMELSRTTKEAIAAMVSERNTCPVCIKAHTMMSVVSMVVDTSGADAKNKNNSENQQHEQALQYADLLLEEMNPEAHGDAIPSSSSHSGGSLGSGGSLSSGGGRSSGRKRRKGRKKFTHLNATAKAEVALVILLFDHMNRVVSVIMGEEMSTAMFSIPRSVAKAMEKPAMIRIMGRLMSPLLAGAFRTKHEPGMTLSLFPADASANISRKALPSQLQGVLLAGLERANAVGRLVDWVDTFQQTQLHDILSEELIEFLDRETKVSAHNNFRSPQKVLQWVENCVRDEVSAELEELITSESGKAMIMVLLLATFAPQTAYQSTHWNALVESVGEKMARSIVAWWSLRSSLKQAKGLDTEIDKTTMIQLLSGVNTVVTTAA